MQGLLGLIPGDVRSWALCNTVVILVATPKCLYMLRNSAINLTFETEGQILMNNVTVSLNHSVAVTVRENFSCNEHSEGCTTKNPPNPAQTL